MHMHLSSNEQGNLDQEIRHLFVNIFYGISHTCMKHLFSLATVTLNRVYSLKAST